MKYVFLALVFLVACTASVEQQVELSDTPAVQSSTILEVEDGERISLSADIVQATIRGQPIEMYGYNGQIPGPALKARQGDRVTVDFSNNLDEDTTVHWHGLRHDNKDDGVPGVTQQAVQPGETFTYELYFPDEGVYWYHPHVREDRQQDLGLAGNMLVVPADENYYNPVNREELLVLDDFIPQIAHGETHANFALMGRYGNTLLVNGQETYELTVNTGDVVRFYVTNVANARPYQLAISDAHMKLVGSDMGKYEREEFVDSVMLNPAERAIVEVYFPREGVYTLQHVTPSKTYKLGTITTNGNAATSYKESFESLRENNDIKDSIAQFAQHFNKSPDHTLELTVDMPMMGGMPCHKMPDGSWMGDCGDEVEHEPIEWEDTMFMMNSLSTTEEIEWIIRDNTTKKENMDVAINANVGDVVKVRLFNDPHSAHPMQHPFHIHGQRFVVTHVDDVPVENKVWKDTVLVPVGSTVDILVEITNPGEWMMHCHIAEHLESGMMSSLEVAA